MENTRTTAQLIDEKITVRKIGKNGVLSDQTATKFTRGEVEIVTADKLIGQGFLNISRIMARRKDLTSATKLVWGAILWHAWNESDTCFPGQDTLMEATGLSRTTVYRSLLQLQGMNDAGDVFMKVIHRGHGLSNLYHIFFKMNTDKQNYVKSKLKVK